MVCGDAPSLAVSRQIFRSSSSVNTSTIFNFAGPMWLSFSKNLARCAQRVRVASSCRSALASRSNSSRRARNNSSYDSDCCLAANVKSVFDIDLLSNDITGISAASLVLGTAIAYMANGYPERREVLETVAGILLIGGLGLMGFALETVFGYP